MLPTSVTVSPSSGSEATSGATSGGNTFYFGGNPTAALLANSGAGGSKWPVIAIGVVAVLALIAALRKSGS